MNILKGVLKEQTQAEIETLGKKNKEVLSQGQKGPIQEVSIFDLTELIGKFYPVNRITLRLIDALRPANFDQIQDEYELEVMNLTFAKMKLTSKLSKYGYNKSKFFEHLDINKNDKVALYQLFSKLAEKYSVYFSV